MKTWTLDVKNDENGDALIEFPEDLLKETGWKEGDRIKWIDRGDGSWAMEKVETQFVLVETISTFRHRYVVEVPVGVDDFGKDKAEWALDTVTMEDASEFSQTHLGETIVSHRVITQDEILKLCDEDNHYCKSWSTEQKMNVFVTGCNDDDTCESTT
jgi:bifunctional DNA-binding transcriptional regulator/antitoxin component of YhaV-PrlF toxin-antitoxin module